MKNQIKDLIFEENNENLIEFNIKLEDYCELNNKEKFSIFRYGYAIQERLINLLLQKTGIKLRNCLI